MEKVYLSQLLAGIAVPTTDCLVSSVVVDSRSIQKNSVFLAIKGERVNGEDYAKAALASGACFVLTENFIADIPAEKQGVVADILDASIALGANFRKLFDLEVVGVTGSVGKTSTKDFIYAALSPFAPTVRSLGNHNNEIGMPQTIFTFQHTDAYAILEMGMSDFNDVHKLSTAAHPKYATITCIGVSHLEKMKTQENILKAKLEICDGMPEDGVLVLNGDDPFLRYARITHPKQIRYYGIENLTADVVAKNIQQCEFETSFLICEKDGSEISCTIPAVGLHNVHNALAAYTLVTAMGFSKEQTAKNLKDYIPSGMRQKVVNKSGITYIEDCYNASPDSMRAAINTLCSVKTTRAIGVLGDMLELGEMSQHLHVQVGEYAREKGVDMLFCYGPQARYICQGFGATALHFDSKEELAQHLKTFLHPQDAVVFKASRGMAFEEIINQIY